MSLVEIRDRYKNGEINKQQYIDLMYQQHALLFEYQKFISATNISSIEIIDGEVIMTFRDSGIKFLCIENDKRLAPLDTLNFDSYELEEIHAQFKLIDDGMNVFDVGANLGWYALNIAKMKPLTKVYCFEPISQTFNYLTQNVKLNMLNNISLFNFGFSDSEGMFSFFYDPQLSVNASLTNLSGSSTILQVKCIVKTMNQFVDEQKLNVDYIKCDVEGAELLVFKGGCDAIQRDLPVIFAEMLRKWSLRFDYHPNDIILYLKKLGYQCFIIEQGMLRPFSLVDDSTRNTNFIFLHEHKHAEKISKNLYR